MSIERSRDACEETAERKRHQLVLGNIDPERLRQAVRHADALPDQPEAAPFEFPQYRKDHEHQAED